MRNRISNCSVDTSGEKDRTEKKTQSVGYMLHTSSSDAATTRFDHVRKNAWERISVVVGDIGCGWLLAVVESWGVVVGVEGAMVSLLLLLIIACVLDVPGTVEK
eukprot:scaffold202891_cov51-Attheya_sp.AAC.1